MKINLEESWKINAKNIEYKFKNFKKNPFYKIRIESVNKLIKVKWSNHIIAESGQCIALHEESHTKVYYFPQDSIEKEYFFRTDFATHCPYKGNAAYWTLSDTNSNAENSVWSYPSPYENLIKIKDYFAFYSDDIGKNYGIKIIEK
tara:strand:+ start:261 stop:698 length:438 start_codon:yes stop_codon:yes gene_type:complete